MTTVCCQESLLNGLSMVCSAGMFLQQAAIVAAWGACSCA